MRVLISFELQRKTWLVRCLAECTRAPISSVVSVADAEPLVHVLLTDQSSETEAEGGNPAFMDRDQCV